jgi:uncharacterized damage-inducible protein DinB
MVGIEVANSFSSITKTIKHIWFAEYVWTQRLKGAPIEMELFHEEEFESIAQQLMNASNELVQMLTKLNDASLENNITYGTSQNETFVQTRRDIFCHVFNHSTYHRGQIVTMLRSKGVNQIPQTDYILYLRVQNV